MLNKIIEKGHECSENSQTSALWTCIHIPSLTMVFLTLFGSLDKATAMHLPTKLPPGISFAKY